MNWLKRFTPFSQISTSILHDEHTFYQAFVRDLKRCKKEVIIESPFITSSRMEKLTPIFKELLSRKVKVHIITRDPSELDEPSRYQATDEILKYSEMGLNIVFLNGHHHRKIAIIDRCILWEGSLNILSHCRSKEIMRRIKGVNSAIQMFNFLRLDEFI